MSAHAGLIDAVESAISIGPMDPVHAHDRFHWGNSWRMEPPPEGEEHDDFMHLQGRRSCAIRAVEAMLSVDTPNIKTWHERLSGYPDRQTAGSRREEAMLAEIAELRAALAAAALPKDEDGERYRWLRDKARDGWEERIFVTDWGHQDYYAPNGIYEADLDAKIDAARAAAGKASAE
jgi:hypothetical protein